MLLGSAVKGQSTSFQNTPETWPQDYHGSGRVILTYSPKHWESGCIISGFHSISLASQETEMGYSGVLLGEVPP